MVTAVLTSKGQTTIPQQIRNYLGLHTGDKLEFIVDEDGRVIVTPLTLDIKDLKGALAKTNKKVSIEDMNRAISKRDGKL